MFFLIAGLVCSALVSIVLKIGGRWSYDRYGMFAVNYASCLVPFMLSQTDRPLPPIDSDFALCLAFALVNGFLYLAGMVFNQINVRRNGAILQSTFSRLGVMVPTALSIVLFGERPSARQLVGIAMVLAAFCIMNLPQEKDGKGDAPRPAFGLLVLGLLFNGIVDSFLKVFQQFGSRALEDWFMGLTFLCAAVACILVTVFRKGRIGQKELVIGVCLGIPNYLSSLFLLKSLSYVSAYIAYPTYSVGSILVVMATGVIVFRERLTKWSIISLAIIIPAILLLNL